MPIYPHIQVRKLRHGEVKGHPAGYGMDAGYGRTKIQVPRPELFLFLPVHMS